ncbi:TRAF-type zinc finger domain-containing protein 1-like isoform X2 [Cylas formicarius]|uniref:TRAF-type zinc finger domain-containing protein 1-like isoform X2 n=1 Tax=Cylas formicarius TaxID=197179 RepID=UPI0029587327|nr:TRAF-type zinc finger domain-containing protein 1-like isoform X2 [Cylas formicarius]
MEIYLTEHRILLYKFCGNHPGRRTSRVEHLFHGLFILVLKEEKQSDTRKMDEVEHEVCANCKKDIPQRNYVMHTMHCARNITLCKNCTEPIPKIEYESHRETCRKPVPRKPSPPPVALEKSSYFQQRKVVEDQKAAARKENYMKRHEKLYDTGFTLRESVRNGIAGSASSSSVGSGKQQPQQSSSSSSSSGMLACKYCDLELPKSELDEHENYCGSRTDKCLECGELVMFKYKQIHMDSNHGFLKLKDEPGPRPSWDSAVERTASTSTSTNPTSPRRRFERLRLNDFDYDPMPYLPSSYSVPGGSSIKKKEGESYKEISRRLDCPAPQPPSTNGGRRRRNPPTELVIPCEFCDTPIPHDDLIQHETGCRPDLARFRPRRNRSPEADDYFIAPPPTSPEVELPCEFCADMIPASQLLNHQMNCTPA